MWRVLFLVGGLAFAGILAEAAGSPQQVVNAALVQVQDCLELNRTQGAAYLALDSGNREGLTLRGLAATLGIGLLSILFFVPAALVAEYLIRRGDDDYNGAAG